MDKTIESKLSQDYCELKGDSCIIKKKVGDYNDCLCSLKAKQLKKVTSANNNRIY